MKWLKQLFCWHITIWERNVYGDEINRLNARSIHRCVLCDATVRKDILVEEVEEN